MVTKCTKHTSNACARNQNAQQTNNVTPCHILFICTVTGFLVLSQQKVAKTCLLIHSLPVLVGVTGLSAQPLSGVIPPFFYIIFKCKL
jgi:hypothetical protein